MKGTAGCDWQGPALESTSFLREQNCVRSFSNFTVSEVACRYTVYMDLFHANDAAIRGQCIHIVPEDIVLAVQTARSNARKSCHNIVFYNAGFILIPSENLRPFNHINI